MTQATQTEAQRLAEWIEGDMSCQGDAEIADELRRLDAAEQTHMRELQAYRLTVENLEKRIAGQEVSGAAVPVQQEVQPVAMTQIRAFHKKHPKDDGKRWRDVPAQRAAQLMRENPGIYQVRNLYTHPTPQGLDAQIIHALSAGMSIEQWQSSVDVRIGSSDLLGRAIASGEETRIELVRRAVSEVFAAQAKQGE